MICDVCGTEYGIGKGFKGTRYKTAHFCSQDCYEKYLKIKANPKAPINFKPEKGSERRMFTDYIQDWVGDGNWKWWMKQAKDIQEEYEIDWRTMLLVLRYCKEYECVEWKEEYGLYQFFPRYIQPSRDFAKRIREAKQIDLEDDEVKHIKRPKPTIGKVEF